MENRTALTDAIEAVFAELSREEVIERLRSAKIAYGSLNEVTDLSNHPQLRRERVDTPNGREWPVGKRR